MTEADFARLLKSGRLNSRNVLHVDEDGTMCSRKTVEEQARDLFFPTFTYAVSDGSRM